MSDQHEVATIAPNSLDKRKTVKQFLIFALVGVSNTAVDVIIFGLLLQLSVYYVIAHILSYGAGMLNSYWWNSRVTFRTPKQTDQSQSAKRINRFVLWNGSMLIISSSLIFVATEFLGWHALISKIVITLLVLVLQFIGSKIWVFKQ